MKNTTRKTIVSALAGIILFAGANGAYAMEPGALRNLRQELRASIAPTIAAVHSEAKIQLQQNQTLRKNIIEQAKDMVKKLLPHRIHGKIASIATDKTSLTVTTDKATVTVYISANTLLKRRFGGNSSVSEFQTGDEVAVIGSQHAASSSSSSSDTEVSAIDARYIRDLSIQRRNTVFVGTITGMNADNFTVKTQSRGTQTVYVSSTTVITSKDTKIALTDLKTGDRVLVKGELWNRGENKIDAAKIMKLPAVPATGSSSSAASSISSQASSASET